MTTSRTLLLFLALLPAFVNAQFFGGYFQCARTGGMDCSISLTTYTDSASGLNQCLAPVEIWNESRTMLLGKDTLVRENGPLGSCDSLTGRGEYLGDGVLRNVYRLEHTFAGPGNYILRFVGESFHSSIVNIGPNQPMNLEMVVVVNPFVGDDVSPQILHDSTLYGCIGQNALLDDLWADMDGDSLNFRLLSPPGVSGYSPVALYADSFHIDALNGIIGLRNPNTMGRFLFQVQCDAYRGGNFIGTVQLARCVTVTDTCAVSVADQVEDAAPILVFPNPVDEAFEIRLPPGIASCKVRVLDLTGKVVMGRRDYFAGSGALAVGHLPAGVYLVEVALRGEIRIFRLIKD